MKPRVLSRLVIASGALLLLAACATLRLNPPVLTRIYGEIRDAQYNAALERVDRLEADPPPNIMPSELAYLRARIYEGQNRIPEAEEQYRRVVKEFPHTPDAYLSRQRLDALDSVPLTEPPGNAPDL